MNLLDLSRFALWFVPGESEMSISCCFGCLTLFGLRDRVTRKLVFFPPKANYSVEEEKNHQVHFCKQHASVALQQTMYILDDAGAKHEPYSSDSLKVFLFAVLLQRLHQVEYVKTARGEKIATMHIACPGSKTTILFSHGNATDIGCMRDHFLEMSAVLGVSGTFLLTSCI